jgi:hypothetical protein
MRTLIVSTALLLPLLNAPLTTPSIAAQQEERSRTEGLKETDQFVKAGGTMLDAVSSGKMQMSKTLLAYNTLVTQPSKNMKGDYKKLMKSLDTMNERVAEARQKIDAMQQSADTYFAGREGSIKNIHDAHLQERAKQRLTDSRKEFNTVLERLHGVGQEFEPFRKDLADQIEYLKSDLTPSAMASLKPNADKLNARGKKVFEDTDEAVARASEYFQGLRSAES